ncbi:hypothetical protein [Trichlorobacter thiogenes]|nr:hypothetical protein [Trichlorobacter thiogenes]
MSIEITNGDRYNYRAKYCLAPCEATDSAPGTGKPDPAPVLATAANYQI